MNEPAYLRIAAEIGEEIRTGQLRPGDRLPSYVELADTHDVSDIVIRNAVGVLRSRGLVRTIERVGTVVADRSQLIRIAPERQLETAETTFTRESGNADVVRDLDRVVANDDVAQGLGIPAGAEVTHVFTRITVDGTAAVVSDYYEPLDITRGTIIEDPRQGPVPNNPVARFPTIGYPVDVLEETLSLRPAPPHHAGFLGISVDELAVTIRQQLRSAGRTVQMADISYPIDRYAGFAFRMQLPPGEATPH